MADDFSTDTIFLGSKRERDERNAVEFGKVTCERVKAIVAYEQLHVTETKRVAVSRTAVLAGSKEPKERHVAQVRHCEANLVTVEGGQFSDIVEDGDWKRLDARRRRVLSCVAAKLAVQAEIG
jgi:hypothetical protein